jgi:hypothetical protein
MAAVIPNDQRDIIVGEFRESVCQKMGVAPFLHQREVWCASDGLELTGIEDPENGLSVRLDTGDIVRAGYRPRDSGRARFVADLGAFKIGKSFGAALWASGFAAVPGARINLVGLEYDICEPEFSYLCEFLLSERGMGLKYDTMANNSRNGKMYLDFPNGASFVCRSWERKDTLKGKEIDAYIYCEAYQLPGIECFTSFSQNLRARRGYAYFATTPDRPWIKQLHEMGHGFDPEWHCTCSIGAEVNPYTFDQTAKTRDAHLMTREKFEIHYNGRMGNFVGRVFSFTRGERTIDASSHPDLFPEGVTSREAITVPRGWEIVGGADTGTYYSSLLVAFNPSGDAFVIDEFPNYRYVAGSPERDESVTIPEWSRGVSHRFTQLGSRANLWADPNSQFKTELRNYGITLLPAKIPVETRTEVTREYFQHGRIYLAPWVTTLAFEIENAAWPEEATSSGKFARVKDRDHTLDCLEHILARRPLGKIVVDDLPKGSFAAAQGWKSLRNAGNIHLGKQ